MLVKNDVILQSTRLLNWSKVENASGLMRTNKFYLSCEDPDLCSIQLARLATLFHVPKATCVPNITGLMIRHLRADQSDSALHTVRGDV